MIRLWFGSGQQRVISQSCYQNVVSPSGHVFLNVETLLCVENFLSEWKHFPQIEDNSLCAEMFLAVCNCLSQSLRVGKRAETSLSVRKYFSLYGDVSLRLETRVEQFLSVWRCFCQSWDVSLWVKMFLSVRRRFSENGDISFSVWKCSPLCSVRGICFSLEKVESTKSLGRNLLHFILST